MTKDQRLELVIENLTAEGVETLTEAILKLIEAWDAKLGIQKHLN